MLDRMSEQDQVRSVAAGQLHAVIERIEKNKKAASDDMEEAYAEAKGAGF